MTETTSFPVTERNKVRRLHEAYPNVEIAEFYSDSRSDSPLAELAEHAYLVHGQTRTPW